MTATRKTIATPISLISYYGRTLSTVEKMTSGLSGKLRRVSGTLKVASSSRNHSISHMEGLYASSCDLGNQDDGTIRLRFPK